MSAVVTNLKDLDNETPFKGRKTFILDTNVLLHDPNAMFSFGDNMVVLPIKVLEEIDTFKRDLNENGKNARTVSRMLDAMRRHGNLAQGAPLQVAADTFTAGGKKVVPGHLKVFIKDFSPDIRGLFGENPNADTTILMSALELRKRTKEPVILVTKDVNFRVRADVYGVVSVDYQSDDRVELEELYRGWRELVVSATDLNNFFKRRELTLEKIEPKPHPHEYFLLKDQDNEKNTALAKWDLRENKIVPIIEFPKGLWGVTARNKEQRFAMDMLMNDQIPLVTLVGKAGTGKTLLALAAGLASVLDQSVYTKMLVSRSIYPLGKDIGFLPGEMEDKLRPWMQPIFDNFDYLLSSKPGSRDRRVNYKSLMDFGQIEIEALTYVRGRTIPNQFIVIDEAQNLTPHEIKTIITRVGEGTKIILTGDPYQIDNPYIDASTNAITYVADKFKDIHLAGHIVMSRGERSSLADVASDIL